MKTILLIPLLAFLLTACTTTEDIAYKATGATVLTVNAAMNEWLDYKNTHPVPQSRVDGVKKAYNTYYDSIQAEKAAVIAFKSGNTNALASAVEFVQSSQASIINIVIQYLPSASVAKLKGIQ